MIIVRFTRSVGDDLGFHSTKVGQSADRGEHRDEMVFWYMVDYCPAELLFRINDEDECFVFGQIVRTTGKTQPKWRTKKIEVNILRNEEIDFQLNDRFLLSLHVYFDGQYATEDVDG